MNLYLLISALRARFRVFALVFLATVIIALVVSLILPKKYVATASVLVDAKDEQSLSQSPISARQAVGYLQTQTELITSNKVARKVAQEMKLMDSPEVKAEFESATGGKGSFEDWVAESLLKNLRVDTGSSSIIQIIYTSNDPAFAAAVANAFSKAYMETILELRVQPTRQAAVWFDEQLKVLRGNLETAYARLSNLQREKGIVAADERFDNENARLDALSTQLVAAQGQTFDARTRTQQARQFLAQGVAADKIPEIIANPFIQGLKAELLRSDAKLQELNSQYGPNYPALQNAVSENKGLRERLDAEMRKIVDGLENSASQSSRREAELRDAMAAQRTRVLQLKGSRDQISVLARDVETAQRAYDAALQRSAISKIEARASQTNVSLLTPASEPRDPSKPKVALNVLLAAIVGIMLGLGLVFLLETIDRRVRTYDDLYDAANVPVLAVLHSKTPSGSRVAAALLPGYALPKPA